MSIDQRKRLYRDIRNLATDEVFDRILPEAIERNGELAARGARYKEVDILGLESDGRGVTLREEGGELRILPGLEAAETVASLADGALSDWVQDVKSAMGLAMTSRVEITSGDVATWVAWEPVLRALLDGRPVHERGAIELREPDGQPLDLTRSFRLDDDREAMSHFLHQAGFLHIENVFSEQEMANVEVDLDAALSRATPDDGASWWAGDSKGVDQAVRVLFFHEKSAALSELLQDDRLQWIGELTGDDHDGSKLGAEGLIKPLDIVSGLSDLPWHKDCGQGGHSYMCSGMTVGISVTGADQRCGALGVVPGSHRANVQTAGVDKSLDLEPVKLETRTGDLTVHCSDTLHRAYAPKDRPRKVVYTGFRLAPKPGDQLPAVPKQQERATRAGLTNVRDRIAAAERQTS